jgi:hypothetical protein
MSKRMLRSRHFATSRSTCACTRARVEPGSDRDERRNRLRPCAPGQPHRLRDFLRRAEHQVVQADGVDAELLGDVRPSRASASSVSCATVVLMLTRSGACLRRAAPAAAQARGVRSNVPFHAARLVVQLAGPSIDTLMCLMNPRRPVGQRLGALVG